MRLRFVSAALIAAALVTVSCSENSVTGPDAKSAAVIKSPRFDVAPPVVPSVRISEIHYDNTGTDAGEAIEISGPAGTRIQGYKIYLYNGNGGAVYTPTVTLAGNIP